MPSATLRTEPISVNVRIILVGTPALLRNLQAYDDDFKRYFKVAAEFDSLMERSPKNLMKYASFVAARCQQNELRPFHSEAVARIVDNSSRLVEHQNKLTTRFMDVSQIITESDFWASKDKATVVMGSHVKKAIDEARLREMIEDGSIHIDTEGEVVGQINGLAVLSLGDQASGKPSRITAGVSLGRGQLLNIEREARMSGRIHDKGFVILTATSRANTASPGLCRCRQALDSNGPTARSTATAPPPRSCTHSCLSSRANPWHRASRSPGPSIKTVRFRP